MVRISEIKSVRTLVCILLDSGESYWLHRDDLTDSGFKENQEYDSDAFFHWIRLCQYPRALNLAVSMLARRICSKEEIRQKLLHHRYTSEVTELVLYKLGKEHLVNDEEFCDQWIRYRLSRKYGLSVIRRELRMKGIPEEMIRTSFQKLDPDDPRDNALSLAEKCWRKIRPDENLYKNRQKVISYLIRKGYDWDTAREACEKAEKETMKNSCTD